MMGGLSYQKIVRDDYFWRYGTMESTDQLFGDLPVKPGLSLSTGILDLMIWTASSLA